VKLIGSLIFFSLLSSAASLDLTAYRIIHTSPAEFVSAMRLPAPPDSRAKTGDKPSLSRLKQILQIKSKSVSGDTVTIEVVPDLHELGSEFINKASTKIRLNQKIQGQNQNKRGYLFDVKIEMPMDYNLTGQMRIDEHPKGSLATLTISDSNMNPTALKILRATLSKMGILAATPEEAEIKDRQENVNESAQ
jgi:hypothetical protein